jgi:hypothetical protein
MVKMIFRWRDWWLWAFGLAIVFMGVYCCAGR